MKRTNTTNGTDDEEEQERKRRRENEPRAVFVPPGPAPPRPDAPTPTVSAQVEALVDDNASEFVDIFSHFFAPPSVAMPLDELLERYVTLRAVAMTGPRNDANVAHRLFAPSLPRVERMLFAAIVLDWRRAKRAIRAVYLRALDTSSDAYRRVVLDIWATIAQRLAIEFRAWEKTRECCDLLMNAGKKDAVELYRIELARHTVELLPVLTEKPETYMEPAPEPATRALYYVQVGYPSLMNRGTLHQLFLTSHFQASDAKDILFSGTGLWDTLARSYDAPLLSAIFANVRELPSDAMRAATADAPPRIKALAVDNLFRLGLFASGEANVIWYSLLAENLDADGPVWRAICKIFWVVRPYHFRRDWTDLESLFARRVTHADVMRARILDAPRPFAGRTLDETDRHLFTGHPLIAQRMLVVDSDLFNKTRASNIVESLCLGTPLSAAAVAFWQSPVAAALRPERLVAIRKDFRIVFGRVCAFLSPAAFERLADFCDVLGTRVFEGLFLENEDAQYVYMNIVAMCARRGHFDVGARLLRRMDAQLGATERKFSMSMARWYTRLNGTDADADVDDDADADADADDIYPDDDDPTVDEDALDVLSACYSDTLLVPFFELLGRHYFHDAAFHDFPLNRTNFGVFLPATPAAFRACLSWLMLRTTFGAHITPADVAAAALAGLLDRSPKAAIWNDLYAIVQLALVEAEALLPPPVPEFDISMLMDPDVPMSLCQGDDEDL